MIMKPLHLAFLFALLCAGALLLADDKPPVRAPGAPVAELSTVPPKPVPQAPDVAAPKLGPDGQPQAAFLKTHESFVSTAKEGKAQVLFLGDSITAGWASNKPIWEQAFGAYQPANFGIGGDRTQHVLWRIQNGELDGIKPKVAVVMIGTNNMSTDPAEGIARGITKIVETIRQKLPQTKVLLLGIFPRGEQPNPLREKIAQVNASVAKLGDNKQVFFLEIGAKFLEPDGALPKAVMHDSLHLTAKGYEIWAEAITPKLAELMK